MKVLVTGATGFIGRPLVKRLLSEGQEVTVLTRGPLRAEMRLPAGCTFTAWGEGYRVPPAALDGCEVIVHLAGDGVAAGRWSAARKASILSSRVDTTRALVAAIAALPRERRPRAFVGASAIGYYGDRGSEILGEDSLPGAGFLADVCRAWEAEVGAASDLGVRTAILRIGIVLGREGGALASVLPPFRAGLGGRIGDGRQWMSWIHLDDMVELLHAAATREDVHGVLNAVAPHPVTNVAFTSALAEAVERPARLPVPSSLLRLAMGEMAVVLLSSQRVEALAATGLGLRFRFPELDPALADLCTADEDVLEREQWFAQSPAELFPFFADARNLERITPEFLAFRVLKTSTAEVGEGTLIDYRLRLHGIPVGWQSRIDEWQPSRRFVDRQVRGPYRLWHHTHTFEDSRGGTLVRDRVRYAVPLGGLGQLVAGGLVRRDLDAIFDFRYRRLREIFAQGGTGV